MKTKEQIGCKSFYSVEVTKVHFKIKEFDLEMVQKEISSFDFVAH